MHSLYCKHLGRWPLSGTKVPGQLFDIPQLSLPWVVVFSLPSWEGRRGYPVSDILP